MRSSLPLKKESCPRVYPCLHACTPQDWLDGWWNTWRRRSLKIGSLYGFKSSTYSALSLCERPRKQDQMSRSITASVEHQRTRRRCDPREDSEPRLRTSNQQVVAERRQKKHTEPSKSKTRIKKQFELHVEIGPSR